MKYTILEKEKMNFAGVTLIDELKDNPKGKRSRYEKIHLDFDINLDEVQKMKQHARKFKENIKRAWDEGMEADQQENEGKSENSASQDNVDNQDNADNQETTATYDNDDDQANAENQADSASQENSENHTQQENAGYTGNPEDFFEKGLFHFEKGLDKFADGMKKLGRRMEYQGKKFESKMNDFGEKSFNSIGEDIEKNISNFGKNFEKTMGEWSNNLEKEMQKSAKYWEQKWNNIWEDKEDGGKEERFSDLPLLSLYKALYQGHIKDQPFEQDPAYFYEIQMINLQYESNERLSMLGSRVQTLEDLPVGLTLMQFQPDQWMRVELSQEEYEKDWLKEISLLEELKGYTLEDYYIIQHGHEEVQPEIVVYCPLKGL